MHTQVSTTLPAHKVKPPGTDVEKRDQNVKQTNKLWCSISFRPSLTFLVKGILSKNGQWLLEFSWGNKEAAWYVNYLYKDKLYTLLTVTASISRLSHIPNQMQVS